MATATTTSTTTPTKSDLAAAARLLATAELSGLKALLTAFDAFDAAIGTVLDGLPTSDYPSNVKRIAQETRNSISHRRINELPSLISSISGSLDVADTSAA